jgi:hypothetical protein
VTLLVLAAGLWFVYAGLQQLLSHANEELRIAILGLYCFAAAALLVYLDHVF